MNIQILNEIKKKIKEEPYQFEMSEWFTTLLECKDSKPVPNCGTAACIAGWAISIHNKVNPREAYRIAIRSSMSQRTQACEILDINLEQGERLFMTYNWPEKFRLSKSGVAFKYLTKKQQAALAIKRINHFIKTEGRE